MRSRPPLRSLAAALLLAACGMADGPSRTGGGAGVRLTGVERLATLAAEAEDSTLLLPAILRGAAGRLYVADAGGPDVRVLSPAGELLLRFGARGGGPGEFQDIRGLALSPSGELAVADSRNRRITVYDAAGRRVTEHAVTDAALGEIAFDAAGRLHVDHRAPVGRPREPGAPTISVRSPERGAVLAQYGEYVAPAEPLAAPYLNSARFAAAPDGGMWVLHGYRSVVVRYDPDRRAVTRIELPPPEGRPTVGPIVERVPGDPSSFAVVSLPAADDVAADARGVLYVLVRHTPPGARAYSALLAYDPDGRPLGSARLAAPTARIAVAGDTLYALRDPYTVGPGMDLYLIRTAAE